MSNRENYRRLPSVDQVLNEQGILSLLESYDHGLVVSLVRQELEASRHAIAHGVKPPPPSERSPQRP